MQATGRLILALSGICLALITGCPGVDINTLNQALDAELVVGGNDQRVLMVRHDITLPSSPLAFYAALLSGNEGAFLDSGDFIQSTYSVVNPATGEAQPITSLLDSYMASDLSDGRLFLQFEFGTDRVALQDLEDGATQEFSLDDLELGGFYPSSVAQPFIAGTGFTQDGQPEFIIFNGLTREVTTRIEGLDVGAVAVNQAFALVDVYPDYSGFDWEDLEAVPPPNTLMLINLASGQRTTLSQSLFFDKLKIEAERGLWFERSDDGDTLFIRAVTLSTGQVSTIFTFSGLTGGDPQTQYSMPLDFNDAGLLVMNDVWNEEADTTTTQTLLWHPYEGAPVILASVTSTLPADGSFDASQIPDAAFNSPWLAGRFVIYHDPNTREWQIYDTSTAQFRSVDPFQ